MRILLDGLGPVTDLVSGSHWPREALAEAVEKTAAAVQRTGAGPGDPVAIDHGGTPAFLADLLGVWHAGACAVCLDPGLTRGERDGLLAFVRPRMVLTADGPASPQREPAAGPRPAGLDDPALILFTSGTTGEPKGVVHGFRSLLARIALNRAFIGGDLARTLCVLPTHFGHGLIGNCLTPLLGGDHLLLHGGGGIGAAPRLGGLIDDHRPTFMSSVPAFWRIALKAGRPPGIESLRRIHVGSAPLSAALWQRIVAWAGTSRVLNMYGITETANWIAGASADAHPPEDGLVGCPWGGEAAVRNGDGVLAAAGEGEILVRTPSLMRGYLRRPDLDASVLVDGWFATGDVGSIDGDGMIRITGRIKSEINRGGAKVHPEEVDLLLERHPDVVEACTFGMPDPVAGEMVAVALRLGEGATVDSGALRDWCRTRIRRDCVPERWYFLPEIPKTDRGKVDRRAVEDACRNRDHNR